MPYAYDRIVKANLNRTRKKVELENAKVFSSVFIPFVFALKARLQVFKFEFVR